MKDGGSSGVPPSSGGLIQHEYQGGLLSLDPINSANEEIFSQGSIDKEYEVDKEPIARGKFASVRRAQHRTTGQMFAAKYIRRRRTATNQENEAMHEIAVLLLGRTDHNIIHLHQVFQTRSEYIIVLEFASGGDLQRLMDEQKFLSESAVRSILRQVLQGLRFLHIQGIAHLDIKPQNLVLMGESLDSAVKLVDFGLSRQIVPGQDLSTIMGTPNYMAPEVINYEAVSLATDMWAIGVVTYVFLSGYTPFGGDTDQETYVNIIQGEYDFPDNLFDHVSTLAKDFISSLLVQRQRDRLTVDECLNHPWMCSQLIEDQLYSTSDPHSLYSVPENDTADSAYSSDSSGSPINGYTTNLNIPDLCRCSIPEEQHQDLIIPNGVKSSQRARTRGNFFSAEMEDALLNKVHRPHKRSTRHSSLIIDRYIETRNNELIRNGNDDILARDSDVDSGVSCHDCEDPRIEQTNTFINDYYYNGSDHAGCWNGCNDFGSKKSCTNEYDNSSLLNHAKPWEKLCTGSVSRAMNQLTVKTVPKKSDTKYSTIEVNDIETDICIMACDYNKAQPVPVSNLKTTNPLLRASIADMRLTIAETKPAKKEHKSTHKSKNEFRDSQRGLSKMRSPMSASNLNIYKSKNNSLGYHSSLSLNQLNLSASHLDLPHETLDSSLEAEEKRDIVYNNLTLPRRKIDKSTLANLRRGNSFHMSLRKSRKRDSNKV